MLQYISSMRFHYLPLMQSLAVSIRHLRLASTIKTITRPSNRTNRKKAYTPFSLGPYTHGIDNLLPRRMPEGYPPPDSPLRRSACVRHNGSKPQTLRISGMSRTAPRESGRNGILEQSRKSPYRFNRNGQVSCKSYRRRSVNVNGMTHHYTHDHATVVKEILSTDASNSAARDDEFHEI